MAKVKLEDGRVINFQGTPTPKDIDEAVNALGPAPKAQKSPFLREELKGGGEAKGFAGDLFQSTLGSKGLLGVAQLPGKALGARSALKAQTQLDVERGESADLARKLLVSRRKSGQKREEARGLARGVLGSQDLQQAKKGLERFAPTGKQALGTTLNAAATVAPVGRGLRGATTAQRASTIGREAVRGAAFGAATPLTEDRTPSAGDIGLGATVGAGVPAVGAGAGFVTKGALTIAKNIGKRISAGLGVSVDEIVANPKVAAEVAQRLSSGKETIEGVLKKSSEQLIGDFKKIQRTLSKNFGDSLEKLAKKDIRPRDIREAAIETLRKNGITVTRTGFSMENAEFLNPVIRKRASKIINKVNNFKSTDGKSLRKLIESLDDPASGGAFKTTGGSDDKQAFNILMRDLQESLRGAVSKNTKILDNANKAFSEGKQVLDVVEQEFGKINFGNLKEVNAVAKKMEGLLKKKGISKEILDKFFTQAGRDPSAIRATEGVRGAFAAEPVAGQPGFSLRELLVNITGGLFEPENVTKAIITLTKGSNLTKEIVRPFVNSLEKLDPAIRVGLIKAFVEMFRGPSDQ